MKLIEIKVFLIELYRNYSEDKINTWAASLAYYMIFSIGPLLLISIAMSGLIFGKQAAQGKILNEFAGVIGPESAEQIQSFILAADKPTTGMIAILIGIIILIFSAVGIFNQLHQGLNSIWKVKAIPGLGFTGMIKDRFLAIILVLVVSFLLLISIGISGILLTIANYLNQLSIFGLIISHTINFIFSLSMVTVFFAMIFKILPNIPLKWSEVWVGAFFTALLFTLGKFILGLYLENSNIASTYGAAGSLIVILIWIYYSSQILFIGAEFTRLYIEKFHNK